MLELARSSNYRGSSCRERDGGDGLLEVECIFDASHVTDYVIEFWSYLEANYEKLRRCFVPPSLTIRPRLSTICILPLHNVY